VKEEFARKTTTDLAKLKRLTEGRISTLKDLLAKLKGFSEGRICK